jgi:hypothetical protein
MCTCKNTNSSVNSIRDFAAVDGCMDSDGGCNDSINGVTNSDISDQFRRTGDSSSSRRSINNMLTSDDDSSDDNNDQDQDDHDNASDSDSDCTR